MAVFRETEIEWKGKTYTVTPSNKLLRRIEREVPLVSYIARAGRDVLVADTAFILSEFVRDAGGTIDVDELQAELMADLYENQAKGYFAIAAAIAEAIVPPSAIKNVEAPAETTTGATEQ